MKKILIILVLIVVLITVYLSYRDKFLPRPVSESCTSGEMWDDEHDRCVPIDTDDKNADQSATFSLANVNRIILTLADLENKVVEITRKESGQKLEYQLSMTEDSPIAGSVLVLDEYATDNTMTGDVFVPYAVNYGGSGSFISVGLFVQKDGATLEMQDTYLVGDRIVIEKLVLDQNATPHILHITYRDRKEGESFAAEPTVPKEATILVSEHRFDGGGI